MPDGAERPAMLPATLQSFIAMIASAINDPLQRKLDYVEEERRILREQLDAATGGKKLSFTANQRRRLYAERSVKTARDERLRHFVFFGERHLRYVIKELMAHYHRERFHQALDGQLIEKSADEARRSGKVVCRSRLGGMLNFYHREAA